LGIIAVSTASTFIRLAQGTVSSLAIAAWRLSLASLMLGPIALASCRTEWRRLSRANTGLLIASGLMLAIHFYTWISSLALTSVAASVALVSTNPLFVSLISYALLRETLEKRMIIGILIAVAGSAIVGAGDVSQGTHLLLGDLLALGGAASVAIYMLIGRRLRAQLSLLAYVVPVYGTAALTLMMAAILTRSRLTGYPAQTWVWLVLVALIPQVIGHSSFNWALGHLPTTYVSLAVLAEPIGSTLLAWLILGEAPDRITVVGGAIILLGIALAIRSDKGRGRKKT
jgi:drug/metabolite transporter (DMT)-like permease